jgi:DNA-binding PucR family transcriptional regulator
MWAWLGSARGPVDSAAVRTWLDAKGSPDLSIGMGEPKSGLTGWRLIHRQALESISIATAKSAPVIEYRGAALLASMARDPILTTSLEERYLHPLSQAREPEILRETVRIYFQTDGNGTSAASALGVSRQTVANRIQLVEKCIGLPLGECRDVLNAALALEELGRISLSPDSRS